VVPSFAFVLGNKWSTSPLLTPSIFIPNYRKINKKILLKINICAQRMKAFDRLHGLGFGDQLFIISYNQKFQTLKPFNVDKLIKEFHMPSKISFQALEVLAMPSYPSSLKLMQSKLHWAWKLIDIEVITTLVVTLVQ